LFDGPGHKNLVAASLTRFLCRRAPFFRLGIAALFGFDATLAAIQHALHYVATTPGQLNRLDDAQQRDAHGQKQSQQFSFAHQWVDAVVTLTEQDFEAETAYVPYTMPGLLRRVTSPHAVEILSQQHRRLSAEMFPDVLNEEKKVFSMLLWNARVTLRYARC
jgi:hypothetical protein